MARGGGHDEILQTQHLGLLPDVPPGTIFGGRLVEEGHREERGEVARRRAPGIGLHGAAVVERRVTMGLYELHSKVLCGLPHLEQKRMVL